MEIYTDGSCLGNPGPGGWAAISACDKITICGGEGPSTTNNIMELTAVIKVLEKLLDTGNELMPVTIYTDSNYVKMGITDWCKKWARNSWHTSTGQPVKNKSLWCKLVKLTEQFYALKWQWVKAHNKNPLNEKVDKLAREVAESVKARAAPQ